MIRRFFIILIVLLGSIDSAFAFIIDDEFGFEKAMLMRNDIQNSLELNARQQVLRSQINEKYHPLFDQKFVQIGDEINKLRKYSEADNCTQECVDAIVSEFKVLENELFEINNNYESEIKSILTKRQKIKYSVLKFNNKRKLKKELNEQIKQLKKD